MAGYAGYSKSNNAIDAESDHKYPKSELCRIYGFSPKKFDSSGPTACEWHHSSKYYNQIDYYDAREAIICGDINRLSTARPNPLQLYNRYLVKCVIIEEAGLNCTFKVKTRLAFLSRLADEYLAAMKEKRAVIVAAKQAVAEKIAAEQLAVAREKAAANRHFKLQRIAQCHRLSAVKIQDAFAGKDSNNICGIYAQIRNWFKDISLEEALKYAL